MANGGGDVSAYRIGVTGTLFPISCGLPGTAGCNGATELTNYVAGSSSRSVSVDLAGTYVYVANELGLDVSVFAIGPAGALTKVSCGAPGTGGCSGAVAPTNFIVSPGTGTPSHSFVVTTGIWQ